MITCGGRPGGALIVPISGMVIAKSASTSSRYASNSSSARSTSSIKRTGGSGREFSSARSNGRRMRNSSEKMSFVAACFEQPDLEHLTGIVPLVHGRVDVQSFVALEADQLGLENGGEGAADVSFPDPRFAFDQQRAIERQGEIHRRREVA